MTYTKNIVDANLRSVVFEDLIETSDFSDIEYKRINDRQYGCILTDLNGVERYVRIGAIVAEEREDMTARELMQAEVDKYNEAQAKKKALAEKRAKKAEADARKRAEKAKEKESAE